MITILQGDWIEQLRPLPDASVHCCVTSPPYWGLRDYGVAGQLGLEKSPDEYVAKLVKGFREVRRVLRGDGTLWLNLGDSYYNYRTGYNGALNKQSFHKGDNGKPTNHETGIARRALRQEGLKEKDLVGIPWMAAFALRTDGWYLRSEVTWCKKSAMPESVTDRPSNATEKIFMFSKSANYFYDHMACRQVYSDATLRQIGQRYNGQELKNYFENGVQNPSDTKRRIIESLATNGGANLRNYWLLGPEPYKAAHFATFPSEIPRRAILLGTSAKGCCPKCGAPWERVVEKGGANLAHQRACGGDANGQYNGKAWEPACDCQDKLDRQAIKQTYNMESGLVIAPELAPVPCTVLDPFGGSGTTGQVAMELGRKAILIELNPKYVELMKARTNVTPGLPLA